MESRKGSTGRAGSAAIVYKGGRDLSTSTMNKNEKFEWEGVAHGLEGRA